MSTWTLRVFGIEVLRLDEAVDGAQTLAEALAELIEGGYTEEGLEGLRAYETEDARVVWPGGWTEEEQPVIEDAAPGA